MANGFIYKDRDESSVYSVLRQHILKPSTQFAAGDGLIFTTGRLERASSATATLDCILNAMITDKSLLRPATEFLTTTLGEEGSYIPCRGNQRIFQTELTGVDVPEINGSACNANANKNLLLVAVTLGSDTNGDFDGGTVLANGEQRTISTSTFSGGVWTLNVNKPFTRAITTGDTAIVVPFSKGARGIRLSSTTPSQGIDPSRTGKSGGKVNIEGVFLTTKAGEVSRVLVSFQV